MSDRLWSAEEVADFLGVTVETLYHWRKRRSGPPAARVGRHLRYNPTKVRAWVDQREAA
ncbi:helix-turn-helix transcriptional regulator [Dactylosporangium sp. McL0621]|uniref:helix-turn-helix transcriptional regulator n=1 Tax=Dactylosporangium sp. McL0621 TaxID=3415678 RepID=UPI003CF28942